MKATIKDKLLLDLAEHTQILHLALEGEQLKDFDERLLYTGHLAMCARLFKIVYLNQPIEELETVFRIESSSYGYATPNDERGSIVKESWGYLRNAVAKYICVSQI